MACPLYIQWVHVIKVQTIKVKISTTTNDKLCEFDCEYLQFRVLLAAYTIKCLIQPVKLSFIMKYFIHIYMLT